MANKAKKTADNVIEVPQQEQTVYVNTVDIPTVAKNAPVQEQSKPTWEIRDRIYYLKGRKTPLTLTIPGKHTRKHSLLYFDPETGKQREIKYATIRII